MASDQGYLDYVLEQVSELSGVTHRAMMGEFILYYQGKIVGGIYDDRLLVKPTESARALLPDAPLALPYEGAKEMLLVDAVDDRALMTRLLRAVAEDLPAPKPKKRQT